MIPDPRIRIDVFDNVYDPSDDTYLLLESIEIGNHGKSLDMGCGTGIIAIHLAKQGLEVTAVDIDGRAISNTIHNARKNGVSIKVVRSDLFERIGDRYDIIAFNPPYLPSKGENVSWDGGEGGVEVIDRFLREAFNHLSPFGDIYMVVSSFTDMKTMIERYGSIYSFEIIKKRHIFFEDIISYRIRSRIRAPSCRPGGGTRYNP